MRPILLLLTTLLGLASLPAQNKVWIVDKNGGAGTWREPSHIAPQDGDLVILRGGDYVGLPLVDKAVTVVHDPRTGPVSIAMLIVSGLSAGKNVSVRGITIQQYVSIQNCKGSVVLDDCTLRGVRSSASDPVTITRSHVQGLELLDTHLQLHGCRVDGGSGLFNRLAGVVVDGRSRLVASDSQLRGGDGWGGTVYNNACFTPAIEGGAGLWLQKGARAELTNCVLAGGNGGPANPPCAASPAGPPVRNDGGTLIQTTRAARTLAANSPVRVGELLTVKVDGQPGDEAFLLFNLGHDATPIPGCGAALFPALTNIGVIHMGRVGAGPLQLEAVVQPLGPASLFDTLSVQALLVPPGGCALSPPTTITLLHRGL